MMDMVRWAVGRERANERTPVSVSRPSEALTTTDSTEQAIAGGRPSGRLDERKEGIRREHFAMSREI